VTATDGRRLRLTIVAEPGSWVVPYARELAGRLSVHHNARVVPSYEEVPPGDLAFFLGCTRIAGRETLAKNAHNIVVHQSALPHGRGWSPLAWQVIEGASQIPVTVFEAIEGVDEGQVYFRDVIQLEGSELVNELRELQGRNAIELCERVAEAYPELRGEPQTGEPTYYAKRGPDACRLDPQKTIAEQFNLLRVCDNERYPAFFEHRGRRYLLRIEVDPRDEPSQFLRD
jgi:methionyl-tRNA formyltransferase